MKTARKGWYIYILRCRDGSLYTGITNDMEGRFARHNSGKGAKYTRARLPVEIVYQKRMRSSTAARKREIAIKRLSRAEKLELIQKSRD